MGIEVKQVAGLEEVVNDVKEIASKPSSSGDSNVLKPTLSLIDWHKNGDKINGIVCTGYTTKGQLREVFKRFFIFDTTNAFLNFTQLLENPIGESVVGTDVSNTFTGCTGITELESFSAPYAQNATNFAKNASHIAKVHDISMPNVNNVASAFEGTVDLVSVESINFGKSITNASAMFKGSGVHSVSEIKLGKATNITEMFANCKNLPEEFPWAIDVSSLVARDGILNIFKGSSVKKIKLYIPTSRIDLKNTISLVDISDDKSIVEIKVVDENGLITIVNNLTDKDFTNWWSSGAVLGDGNLLAATDATGFNDLTNYAATNMAGMFSGNKTVTSLPDFSTNKTENASNAFKDCALLTKLPKMDLSKVSNFTGFASGASTISSFTGYDTSAGLLFASAFDGCTSLVSASVNTKKATTLTNMFNNCSALTELNDIDAPEATIITGMLNGCSSLTKAMNISIPKATTLGKSFSGFAGSVKTIDVSAATSLNSLFEDSGITTVDAITCGLATTMASMFKNAKKLTSVVSIDTSKVTNMGFMFFGCSSLPETFPWTIDVSATTGYRDIQNIFGSSSVKNVTVKYTVSDTVPDYICPIIFGDSVQTVTVINATGATVVTRDRTFNPVSLNQIEKFLTAGKFTFIVPPGVTSVKVAAVSGFTINMSNYSLTSSSCQPSYFGTKLNSLKVGVDSSYSWTETSDSTLSHVYGYLPVFDATYNCGVAGGYAAGCTGSGQATKYVRGYAVGLPSFVQNYIDVTPGESIDITVGGGTALGGGAEGANKQHPGHANGYVLVGYSWDDTYKKPVETPTTL